MEQEQAQLLDTWAIVELFGHNKIAGYIKNQAFGTDVMVRVDVPELPEREVVIERPQYVGSDFLPAGSKVLRGSRKGLTRFLGVKAIYAINPCDELTAMRAIEQLYPQDIKVVSIAESPKVIAPPRDQYDEDEDEDDLPM